ncbi:MAG: hypothetical protein R3E10_13850 [Gemmatimonadota bacterium]
MLLFGAPRGLTAQQPTQAQVDSLRAEIARLTAALDSLRSRVGSPAAPEPAPQNELARLRAAAAAAAANAGAPDTARPAPQEFVGRQRSLQALNPEISLTGDFFGAVRSMDASEDNFVPREIELALQSALDPFSRAKVFAGIETPGIDVAPFEEGAAEEEHGGGISIEEAYLEWVNLPGGISAKVGQFYQQFGTMNRWHSHALYSHSRSLPALAFIGEEPLAQAGVSIHWLAPTSLLGGTYQVTGELTRSSNETLFGTSTGPTWLGHLNAFYPLGSAFDLDLGMSALTGRAVTEAAEFDRHVWTVEGALTWSPPGRTLYRGLVLRGGVLNRSGVPAGPGSARGAWGLFETRLSQQWYLGGRADWSENPEDPDSTARLFGPTLTWWQSEYVRLRAEYAWLDGSASEGSGLFTLQFTWSMGPHKHETY